MLSEPWDRVNQAIHGPSPRAAPARPRGCELGAAVQAWFPHQKSRAWLLLPPPFPAAPLAGFSRCHAGVLNKPGQNFPFLPGITLQWGEPSYFVLGPWGSSWSGGIFRARCCEGASSTNPPPICLWEIVPVRGFLWLSDPLKNLKNLHLWGIVVVILSQVQLGPHVGHSICGHLSGCIHTGEQRE